MVRKNSAKAWFLAARPKTLTAALIPVFVGSALAYSHGAFRLLPAALCLVFAALMQVAANFINDLFDFLKGADREDRLGPERACAQGWISPKAMKAGIAATLSGASLAGLSLLGYMFVSGRACVLGAADGGVLFGIGVACIVFAFLYTTMLSYCGLGDLLVWVFFGFVPVAGTYYVQAGGLPPEVWWLSAACGLATDTLLVLNNYRDRDADRVSGKRTLVVAFGKPFGRYFYLAQGIAAYACAAALSLYGHVWMAVFPLLYLVPHFLTWRKMVEIGQGRELNRVLGLTSRNMLVFALLMVVALWAGVIFPPVL